MKLEAIKAQSNINPITSYGLQVLTVDDHALVRIGLELLVQEIDPKAKVVHARSTTEALVLVQENPYFDLILLDIDIPDIGGLRLLPKIREISPAASVVVITGNQNPSIAKQVLALGAKAFFSKNTDSSLIKQSLSHVIHGHQGDSVSEGLANRFSSRSTPNVGMLGGKVCQIKQSRCYTMRTVVA